MDVTKQNRDYKSLQPIAQKAYLLFMEECKKQGIKLFPTEFLRTQERQWYLACQGRTVSQAKAMGVPANYAEKYANPKANQVTWTLKSNHSTGKAWDMACSPPQELYDANILKKANKLAEQLGLQHGGSYGDSPHFECPKDWKEPEDDLKEAVNSLNKKGIINTISAWDTLDSIEKSKSYLPDLIANFIKVKFGIKVCCYNDSVAKLYQKGIITNLEIWLGNEVPSANNIKFLLIKMSKEV